MYKLKIEEDYGFAIIIFRNTYTTEFDTLAFQECTLFSNIEFDKEVILSYLNNWRGIQIVIKTKLTIFSCLNSVISLNVHFLFKLHCMSRVEFNYLHV